MSIISLVLLAISTDLSLIFIASFLRGSAQVIIIASTYVFASGLITPKERAKLFGLFNASFFLNWGLAGTIIAGPITDYLLILGVSEVLAHRTAFLAATFVTFIGVLLLILLLIWIRVKS